MNVLHLTWHIHDYNQHISNNDLIITFTSHQHVVKLAYSGIIMELNIFLFI